VWPTTQTKVVAVGSYAAAISPRRGSRYRDHPSSKNGDTALWDNVLRDNWRWLGL
jgi:hypothetical protein